MEEKVTPLFSPEEKTADPFLYTGYIQDGQDTIDTRTGEVFTPKQFEERIKLLNSKPKVSSKNEDSVNTDKYGKIYQFPIYKHRSSVSYTAKLLGINDRKCEQIHRVYHAASPIGVIEASPMTRKALGNDYRRNFRGLIEEGWMKLVTLPECTADSWMINPEFVIARDFWSTKRQKWLRDCYNRGHVSKYKFAEYLSNTHLLPDEAKEEAEKTETTDTFCFSDEIDEFTAYAKMRQEKAGSNSHISSAA